MTGPNEPVNPMVPVFLSAVILPFRRRIRFGDIVQIDSTRCDFEVWRPKGPQKWWAVLAVDTATKIYWLGLTSALPGKAGPA